MHISSPRLSAPGSLGLQVVTRPSDPSNLFPVPEDKMSSDPKNACA